MENNVESIGVETLSPLRKAIMEILRNEDEGNLFNEERSYTIDPDERE